MARKTKPKIHYSMTLRNCPDCDAEPGQPHDPNCDIQRCSVCGGQRMCCGCKGHDKYFARWTGMWPGKAEIQALGYFSKWVDGQGWVRCDANDPEADGDLNLLAESEELKRIFFIKPKKV